jgi:hypothetical protein
LEARRNKEGFFCGASRGNVVLLTPPFQTFSFWNPTRINFCCFKLVCLWKFLIAAPENEQSIENDTFATEIANLTPEAG